MTILQSCDLEEVNVDPGNPKDATINLLLPDAIAQSAFNQSATSARLNGIVLDQLLGFDAQQEAYERYVIGSDVFNNLWRTGIYSGVLKSSKYVNEKAKELNSNHYQGIAKVLTAKELAFTSSMFGDIPYSEALQRAENLTPSYDSQQEIFTKVISLLDEAIADFSADDNSGIAPGSDDLLYGGSIENWKKFAYSLKARYLMIQSKRGASMSDVLSAVENGFSSSADNATYAFSSAITGANPLAKFGEDRSGTIEGNGEFYDRLAANNDPRLDYYVGKTESGYTWHGGSKFVWTKRDSKIPMMSYSELMFIKAEAMARNGASNADVSEVLKMAINANVALVTGSANDDFASAQSNLDGKSGAQVIEAIVNAAYYSYYGHAFQQAWDNYRRTGYPALTPNPNASRDLDPSGVIPRRWIYPASEETSNKANLEAAISAQGGDLLDNELWLFK